MPSMMTATWRGTRPFALIRDSESAAMGELERECARRVPQIAITSFSLTDRR